MNTMSMKKNNVFGSYLLMAAICCLLSLSLYAQNTETGESKIVRGKVINQKDKSPIEHVSVTEVDKEGRIVKGTNTDIDGNYALKLSTPGNKISFSFIGFKTVTVDAKGKTTYNLTMENGNADLDEVVITAGKRTDNGNLSI